MNNFRLVSVFFCLFITNNVFGNFRITNNTGKPIQFWLIIPEHETPDQEHLKVKTVEDRKWYIQDIDLNNVRILYLFIKYENELPAQFKLAINPSIKTIFFNVKKNGSGFLVEPVKSKNNIKSENIVK